MVCKNDNGSLFEIELLFEITIWSLFMSCNNNPEQLEADQLAAYKRSRGIDL